MRGKAGRLIRAAVAAAIGWCVGWVLGTASHILPNTDDYPFLAEHVPLPHHVPKYPGGASFRFAMAHDVIHERFARHGPEHYRVRDRITRDALSKLGPDDPARFPLMDDLGVDLERLGKPDEAAAVLREKLDRQLAKGLKGRDLYTSYANLGTFLIHANFPKAAAGDPSARGPLREGLEFIRKAVGVNPEAHFGREQWQAAIAEFLTAALDKPDLLRTFDCLGNRLDLPIESALNREGNRWDAGYGRPNDLAFSKGEAEGQVPAFFLPNAPVDDPAHWAEFRKIRDHITKIGAEAGWDGVPVPSHRSPVAFDEPAMGIIGMWRQGGGASPHFALALGETMLRVGQRYIAWSAFERAGRLADRYSRDPATQQFLRDHCRRRQTEIEQTLTFRAEPGRRYSPPWQYVSPPPDGKTVAGLHRTFDAELQRGLKFQRDYQDYEAAKIAAGTPITDSNFFDAFYLHQGRTPIASPVGPEEWFAGVPRSKLNVQPGRWGPAWGLFGAGSAVMGSALIGRLWSRRMKPRRDRQDEVTFLDARVDPSPP